MHVLGIMGSDFPGKLIAIQSAIENGDLPNTKIGVVICNKPNTPIVQAAQRLGIPNFIVAKHKSGDIDLVARDILHRYNVELVILAGYMKKVGSGLLDTFPDHILNIHPGPIPRFGGKGMGGILVQEAVLAAGAKYTGPVVHIVDEEYDHGPVLGYYPVKVHPNDTAETLRQRCLKAGDLLYVQVIKDFLYRMDHPEDF
jgi:phosphoribosylglycinamide formyltransferase 1